jgi:DNA-binding CsgD family transcriptional regulator
MPSFVHHRPPKTALPFASDPARLANCVMHWTEALHGSGCLRAALEAFSGLAQARVVHVYRLCLDGGRRQTIATLDHDPARSGRPLVRELGLSLVPDDPLQMRPGTLWTLGELDPPSLDALEPRGRLWMEDRGFRDAALIPLSLSDGVLDLLEFYTFAGIGNRQRVDCEVLAALSAEVWGRRPKGQIAAWLSAIAPIEGHSGEGPRGDPLSPTNHWGLTGAELRICALIRDGIDPADLVAHTGSSVATVRSHLRSIYSKAQVTGQVGLVRALLAETAPAAGKAARGLN